MNELSRAWRFLFTTLTADAELTTLVNGRVHRGAIPQDGDFPAIIYALLAPGSDVVMLGGHRLWSAPVFKVVAAGETPDGLDLEPIADRIDAVLMNASGATDANGYVYTCQRLRPFELMEQNGQSVYQQLGGEYELTVRTA